MVLPVADRHNDYAAEVAAQLREAGVRVQVDERSESVGRKIRDAELAKVPFMLVVGDKEQEAGRRRGALARGGRPRARAGRRGPGADRASDASSPML